MYVALCDVLMTAETFLNPCFLTLVFVQRKGAICTVVAVSVALPFLFLPQVIVVDTMLYHRLVDVEGGGLCSPACECLVAPWSRELICSKDITKGSYLYLSCSQSPHIDIQHRTFFWQLIEKEESGE